MRATFTKIGERGSFLFVFCLAKLQREEVYAMKDTRDGRFATNKGGVIKAPRPVTDQPKATVVKGNDLRNGKGK